MKGYADSRDVLGKIRAHGGMGMTSRAVMQEEKERRDKDRAERERERERERKEQEARTERERLRSAPRSIR